MNQYPILSPVVEQIPVELRQSPQWVNWRADWQPDKGKYNKPPIDSKTLDLASSTDAATWADFETAVSTYQQHRSQLAGVGFVVTDADDYVGVDLDGCVEVAPDGSLLISPEAQRQIDRFKSYTEYSPSSRGIRIFVKGHLPPGGRKKGKIEVYENARFLTVTGRSVTTPPSPVSERQREIEQFHAEVFAKAERPEERARPRSRVELPDDELLQKAFQARNGVTISALYSGDWSSYPSRSEADLALCGKLAFWTGPDAARLDGLFRRSGLMREKWDKSHYSDGSTYGESTIRKAIDDCREFYQSNGHAPKANPGTAEQGSGTPSEEPVEPWEDPAPFHEYSLPSFPTAILPSWLRTFVEGLAEATQTPVDLTAMTALSAVSSTVAGRTRILARDGWVEPLNIYTAVAMLPGNRKSAVSADATKPLIEYERFLIEETRKKIAEEAAERRSLEARRERLEKECAKSDGDELGQKKDELRTVARELAEWPEPRSPQLLCDDTTPEALATLLAEQNGRMALFSAEGGIFENLAGRYSSGATNFDVFLKAHAGDDLRVNRRGRAEHVQRPALTVGLSIQPDVLRGLADKPGFRGRGLIGRFLYAIPPSTIGHRKIRATPLNDRVKGGYSENLKELLRVEVGELLLLSSEADDLLASFEAEIEADLGDGGSLASLSDWAGKLAGAVVRLAGILHLAEHVRRLSPWPSEVQAASVRGAIEIGRYLIPHARAAYAEMGTDPKVESAKVLLRWLEKYVADTGKNVFTKREAHQSTRGRSCFRTVEDLEPALRLLEAHGYIREKRNASERRPGRKSESYEINPNLTPPPQNTQNTQNPPSGPPEERFEHFEYFESGESVSNSGDQEEF